MGWWMVEYVVKRDGRIVKFDVSRIRRAVSEAMKSAGSYDADLCEKIVDSVVKRIEMVAGEKGKIRVEEVQDIIEIELMRNGLYSVAKEFIIYREKKRRIREEKGKLLNKDPNKLTETEKRFSINAIRVLSERYLWKDPATLKPIEDVDGMFKRVAVLASIPEILYDESVYDKDGRHYGVWEMSRDEVAKLREELNNNPEKFRGRYSILRGFNLNENHFERLIYLYEQLAKEGKMKVTIGELLDMLENNPGVFKNARYYVKKFFEGMTNQIFMPNTPALVNAGKPLGGLSACFTVEVFDSLESILDTAKEIGIISKSGGGIGLNLSSLRPASPKVPISTTSGISSGVVSWLQLYNSVLEQVKQGSVRRGAGMAILEYWHPEIEQFIHAKEGNRGDNVISNFNLSVGTDEKFWEAVFNNEEIPLIAKKQIVVKEGNEYRVVGEESVVEKSISARRLLDEVSQLAWKTGDPGMLYFDNGNKYNVRKDLFGEIRVTNPCVTGDMRIPTPNGLIRIDELYETAKRNGVPARAQDESKFSDDGDKTGYMIKVLIPDEEITLYEVAHGKEQKAINYTLVDAIVWKIGTKDTVRIVTEEGYEIGVSSEAKIMTSDGKFVRAKDLKPGDKIVYPRVNNLNGYDGQKIDKRLGLLLGWLIGNGYMDEEYKYVGLYFDKTEENLAETLRGIVSEITGSNVDVKDFVTGLSVYSRELFKVFSDMGVKEAFGNRNSVPEIVFRANLDFVKMFLSGLFTASGHVDSDGVIRLTSSSKELLKGVQVLLNLFGVKSVIRDRQRLGGDNIEEYIDEDRYELSIEGYNKRLFLERIGFIDPWEYKEPEEFDVEENVLTVREVVDTGKQVVYDITVLSDKHIYTPNLSIIKSNCGEEYLYPYESCNLASINIEKFVKKDQDGNVYFDWDEFHFWTRIVARMLDNFVDVNVFPLEKIEKRTKMGRNIGVGLMGLANALYRLEIPYNSKEGYEFMSMVAEHLTYFAFKESVQLAKERGTFSYFWETKYKDGHLPIAGYYDRESWTLDWDELVEEIKTYGLRNVDVTTCPPTGTVSMIADTSSGIEPNFALVFKKIVTIGEFYYVVGAFEEKLREYGLYSDSLLEKINENRGSVLGLKEIPKKLQRVFVTAMDIHWLDHIIAQATIQKWITNSISKTINLPNNASVDDIKVAYIIAHELGCKGLTVYRDGSLEIQVLKTETSKNTNVEVKPSDFAIQVVKELIEKKPQLLEFIRGTSIEKYFIRDNTPFTFELSHQSDTLNKHSNNQTEEKEDDKDYSEMLGKVFCPVCYEKHGELVKLVFEGGCKKCPSCGWSACTIA